MSRPRRCDEDQPVDIGGGSVVTRGPDSPLAEALLDATMLLTRINVLLSEASADDWRDIEPRLNILKSSFRSLPKKAPGRKIVGF